MSVPLTIRLAVAGAAFGVFCWLLSLTPAGRLSGTHLNPAVSFGFFFVGRMRAIDAFAYAVAQTLGSVIGIAFASYVMPQLSAAVDHGAVHIDQAVGAWQAFAYEAFGTITLVLGVFVFVSRAALERYTFVWVCLALSVIVAAYGAKTGASVNPARWFGPAVVTGVLTPWFVYVLAPCFAALVAGIVFRASSRWHGLRPRHGKLQPDARYRSIFIAS